MYGQENQGTRYFRYDPVNDRWDELAAAPLSSGDNGGAALLNGKIYTSYTGLSQLGVYDIAGDSWTTLSSPLPGTADIAGDDERFLFLLRSTTGRKLDPETGFVAALGASPLAFSQWGGLRHVGGVLYGHSGSDNTGFAAYDIAADAWRSLPALPAGAVAGAAVDPVSRQYFAYGPRGGRSLYRYSIDDAAWDRSELPFAVDDGGLAWLPDPVPAVYLVQGEDGTALARLVSRPRFLAVDPVQGIVPPSGRQEVTVRFDGSGLPRGAHEALLVVTSNDPFSTKPTIPVTLTIEGAPDLRLDPADALDFGLVVVGETSELPLVVENIGTDPLVIDPITTEGDGFAVSPASIVLPAGATETLEIRFLPLSTAVFAGDLLLASNDPDTPLIRLPVTGRGVTPPVIEIDPEAIDAVVPERGRTTRILTVANAGQAPLTLTLDALPSSESFLTLDPAGAPIPGGASIEVDVELDAETLSPGTHAATLRILSNDPATPQSDVPVSLRVDGAPDLALRGEPIVVESSRIFASPGAETVHTLVVPVPPVGPATLVLTADGDFGAASETATLTAEGRILVSTGGAGPDCAAVSSSVAIDTTTLARLVSDGMLEATIANSGQVGIDCPTNRHHLALRYETPLEQIDFGEVVIGQSGEQRVRLINRGSQLLVIDSITAGLPQFTAVLDRPSLAPGEEQAATVRFTPSSDDSLETELTIVSNDPDVPQRRLSLSGRGAEPPIIGVEPAALILAVSPGERDARRLTLSNTGGGPLEFEVEAVVPDGLDSSVVTVSPFFGTVLPDDSRNLTVRFDATALEPGLVEPRLLIHSNDPARATVDVRLSLSIPGDPDLALAGEKIVTESVAEYNEAGGRTLHQLLVPRTPAGGGTLELVALGDFGLPIETATIRAEGRVLGSVGGVGIDCSPASGEFPIAAGDLRALAADGVVEIEVQNSPDVGVFCPRDQHTIRLSYDTPPERVDFGTVFAGFPRVHPLVIRNDGRGDLHLSLSSTDTDRITLSAERVTVPTSGAAEILLTYAPVATDALSGTLSISSDDPDEPLVTLELVGRAIEAPAATVDPEAIFVALPPRGDLGTTRSVRLANSGGSDLIWSAELVDAPIAAAAIAEWSERAKGDESDNGAGLLAVDRSGGPDSFGYRFRDSDDADGPIFLWQEISANGTAVGLTGDDQTSGPVAIGFDFPFYGERFRTINISSNGWLSFTSEKTSFSNPDVLPNAGFSVPENLIAPFWDDLYPGASSTVLYHADAERFVVQYTGWTRFASEGELTFQVVLFPSGNILFQYRSMSGTLDSATIGIQNGTKSTGLLVAYNEHYVHDRLAVELTPTRPGPRSGHGPESSRPQRRQRSRSASPPPHSTPGTTGRAWPCARTTLTNNMSRCR